MSQPKDLLVLFQRAFEPSFFPKDGGKTSISLPANFYTERYKNIGQDLQTRFGEETTNTINVAQTKTPDLSFCSPIKRDGSFSLFIDLHQKIAGQLITIFMNQPDIKSLFAVAAYCRDRLNPYLFQYAYSVAIQHRKDTKNLSIPSVVQTFPDQFVDPKAFPRLGEEGRLPQDSRQTIDIPSNYTASDRELEQRLAYFREDIGVNMHHWHWHLVYPGQGPAEIVNKDRRGELFYYMHNQIISRYNVERFCNKLPRVVDLANLRVALPEAYFPKMIRGSNNRAYPGRYENTLLRDMNRSEGVVSLGDMERWRDRIIEGIDSGFLLNARGDRIMLTEENGIDLLGNIIEACQLSVNTQLYGNFHNQGHNLIAFIHDPDGRHLEDYGVMSEVTTAMRDPLFYRLHGFCDTMWRRWIATLPEYPANKLGYDGVTVNSVTCTINRANAQPNTLLTFWQKSEVDLNTGLDFGPGNVYASFRHLQYAPFSWRITVNNSGARRQGTCRIFITPKMDERGTALQFKDQRNFMIELDRFVVTLNQGDNVIVRRSDQSSITIPYDRTFRRVGVSDEPQDAAAAAAFRFCGCGWPSHMLLPKGTPEGMQFDTFAMISNYADDLVDQPYDENVNCNDAVPYCGLRDRKFPDKRKMGYPFDRVNKAATLAAFVANYRNMKLGTMKIKFTDTVIDKF